MAPSCWFFWAWWLTLMLAVAAADQQLEGCFGSAKRCGNLTISHPFWLTDVETGRSCGAPVFEVDCSVNKTPTLRSSGVYGFAILNISYEEHSLHVVDLGKLKYLNDNGSCHVPSWNTSSKLQRPFKIDPGNLGLVLYNCTTAAAATAALRDPALVPMRCGNKDSTFDRVGGYYYNGSANYSVEGCDATIVPVLGSSSGDEDAGDYEQLISDGFILNWDPPSRSNVVAMLKRCDCVVRMMRWPGSNTGKMVWRCCGAVGVVLRPRLPRPRRRRQDGGEASAPLQPLRLHRQRDAKIIDKIRCRRRHDASRHRHRLEDLLHGIRRRHLRNCRTPGSEPKHVNPTYPYFHKISIILLHLIFHMPHHMSSRFGSN